MEEEDFNFNDGEYEFDGTFTCRESLIADIHEANHTLREFAKLVPRDLLFDNGPVDKVFGFACDQVCSYAEEFGFDISDVVDNPYYYWFYMPDGKVYRPGEISKGKRK